MHPFSPSFAFQTPPLAALPRSFVLEYSSILYPYLLKLLCRKNLEHGMLIRPFPVPSVENAGSEIEGFEDQPATSAAILGTFRFCLVQHQYSSNSLLVVFNDAAVSFQPPTNG